MWVQVRSGAAFAYGFSMGTLSQNGAVLVKMPWGIVSLIDDYVDFILLFGWIVNREKYLLFALLLVILVMVLVILLPAPMLSGL